MANTFPVGFSRSAVEELSRLKGEPAWMLEKRLQAWDIYEQARQPHWGGVATWVHCASSQTSSSKNSHPYVPASADDTLPAAIEQSLQEALVDQRSGLIVQRKLRSSSRTCTRSCKSKGVILTDLESAVRDYPELVQQYFMTTCVPVESIKYTALHAAFWSGGVFLYIPKGVEIEDPS